MESSGEVGRGDTRALEKGVTDLPETPAHAFLVETFDDDKELERWLNRLVGSWGQVLIQSHTIGHNKVGLAYDTVIVEVWK